MTNTLGARATRGDHEHELPDGLGVTTLSLSFNAVGPFDVPVFGCPAGYTGEGYATVAAQLTTGPGLVTGLLDVYGDPIPDGWTFPAFIFVGSNIIYDIYAVNAYAFGAPGQGGIVFWSNVGEPNIVINLNGIFLKNLPTSNPAVVGQVWSNSGVLTVSAG